MKIKDFINERIEKVQSEKLYESLRPIISRTLQSMMNEGRKIKAEDLAKKLMKNDKFKKEVIKYLENDKDFDGFSNSLDGKTYNSLMNLSDGAKRKIVSNKLEDEKYDWAPLAYKLWPDMSEDAARSWFSKKVAGKNGESFNDDEVSTLFSLLNGKL